jgi:hypothetical protein
MVGLGRYILKQLREKLNVIPQQEASNVKMAQEGWETIIILKT